MKKNYNLIFLFLGILCNNSLLAQAPVANPAFFEIFASDCNSPFMYLTSSGSVTNTGGGIDWNTVDLNQNQPGIQSEINVNSQGFIMVSNGNFSFMPFPIGPPLQSVDISYTVQDLMGNTSNVSTITFLIHRLQTYASIITQPTCEYPNGGSITIHNVSAVGGPCTLKLYKDGISEPVGTYQLFPGQLPDLFISELTFGYYGYEIMNDNCGIQAEFYKPAGYLTIDNPLSATGTGTYQDYNNDGIVNVGDIVNYQFTVFNSSPVCTMNDVEVYYLITPTGGPIPNLAPSATDTTTLTGYAPITQEHINSGLVHAPINIGVSNPGINPFSVPTNVALNISDGIKLNAFIDTNNNGVQDNDEQNYTEGSFSYAINSGALHHINTNNGVHYLYETNPANVYDLHYSIDNNYCGSQYLIAQPNYSNVTVADGSGVTTYNFAITAVSCQDLSVQLYNNNNPRPGFVYNNTMVIKNEGNQTTSGSLSFQADSTLSLVSNSVNATQTANGFTYNVTNMAPGESRYITVLMQVPTIPSVSLGQMLTNTVTIANTDANAANNSAPLTSVIVGSYDPNDKTEAHGGKIVHSGFTADDYLTYTIRFENTGTAEAINIRVDDVLDNKLNESSIKMVRASHNYTLDRIGNHLTWRFDGVNLPPSVAGDDITGHGYVVFQVKPKAGFALGDVIPNTANIYFDFNPAIVTNTCTTEFVPFLSNAAFALNELKYAPNPVQNKLSISNQFPIEKVSITTTLGQVVLEKNMQSTQAEMDLSTLAPGVYFVKAEAQKQIKIFKIIKE